MHVSALYRYPVKSLGGDMLETAAIERIGIAGDRRWMVITANGRFLTRREASKMAHVHASVVDGGIMLYHASLGDLFVAEPEGHAQHQSVTVWRDQVDARICDPAAHDYLTRALGRPVQLVWMHDITVRPIDPTFGTAEDRVSFADGFPVLLTNEGSLADLNNRLQVQVSMRRFRPNLVVSGTHAWAEDEWRRIRIGSVVFSVVKPCSRCVIITQDPDSGERHEGNEPLQALRSFHKSARGEIMFGQNLIPLGTGTIKLGDRIEILETGPSNLLTH